MTIATRFGCVAATGFGSLRLIGSGLALEGEREIGTMPALARKLDPQHGERLKQTRRAQIAGIDRVEPAIGD